MRSSFFALAVALSLVGCRPDDQRTDTIDPTPQKALEDMAPEAVAQLDSANAAQKAGDYTVALGHYRRVTEIEPGQASGWFGLFMANRALGNQSAADSALAHAQSLAPGATLIHPTAADTTR